MARLGCNSLGSPASSIVQAIKILLNRSICTCTCEITCYNSYHMKKGKDWENMYWSLQAGGETSNIIACKGRCPCSSPCEGFCHIAPVGFGSSSSTNNTILTNSVCSAIWTNKSIVLARVSSTTRNGTRAPRATTVISWYRTCTSSMRNDTMTLPCRNLKMVSICVCMHF